MFLSNKIDGSIFECDCSDCDRPSCSNCDSIFNIAFLGHESLQGAGSVSNTRTKQWNPTVFTALDDSRYVF
jgi:hypothetical protein